MMKNTEWGAVAYLTNSQYGRCAGENCTEVKINNSANYVTGSSAVSQPTCGYTESNEPCNKYDTNTLGQDTDYVNNYSNSASVVSSTTNNYTGVFDMSGGAWEYVMGVMLDKEGKLVSGRNNDYNSNFIGTLTYPEDGTEPSKLTWTELDGGLPWPDSRYYDTYSYGETDQEYNRGLFGDATKELGPFYLVKYISTSTPISAWYTDAAFIITNQSPWVVRGNGFHYGNGAGIFAVSGLAGQSIDFSAFRIVLTL